MSSPRAAPKKAGPGLTSSVRSLAGLMGAERSARDAMREAYRRDRNVRLALDLCTGCGACLAWCPAYVSTGDQLNSPLGRISAARSLLRGIIPPDDAYRASWLCLTCGACSSACPFGLDVPGVSRAIRAALLESGSAPEFVSNRVVEQAAASGGSGFGAEPLRALVRGIAAEIFEEKGLAVDPKVDERAEALLLVPSDDLVLNVDTLKGYMAVLGRLGVDFAFSHRALAENYGLFLHPAIMRRLADGVASAAEELGVKYVIVGECGHAWRVATGYLSSRLRGSGIGIMHIFHIVSAALRRNELELHADANGDLVYEYRDPCQYSRGGGLVEEPREILRRAVRNYIEPSLSGTRTVCCGAGGGNLAPELLPLTLEHARLWYDAALRDGADVVVWPCATCKAHVSRALRVLNPGSGRNVRLSGLMELVYRALPRARGRCAGRLPHPKGGQG